MKKENKVCVCVFESGEAPTDILQGKKKKSLRALIF